MNKDVATNAGLEMTGGEALAKALRAHECGPIFGMGGFQLLPFYDAARRLNLKHFLINDERSGAFAADAYARVAGRPGIVDATQGPGATNLVTGLTESLNAGVPIIAITGNTTREHSWKNMTQECRQLDILRPAVKDILRVEMPQRIPELVARAFALSTSGRPGPVLLDMPEDVVHARGRFSEWEFNLDPATVRYPSRRARADKASLLLAAEQLAAARRPVILAGGGIHLSGAHAALLKLAEAQSIPVATTMSGKGSLPCTHPLSVGLFGRYSRIANDLIAQSDCILVVGCKLGEIATKRYALLKDVRMLIHLDSNAEEFGRTRIPDIALWGDGRDTLEELSEILAQGAADLRGRRRDYLTDVAARTARWQNDVRPKYESNEVPIAMARLIGELNTALPADSVLVADGGFAAHWTGLLYDTKSSGRTYVANRGMASIGYGLPGSIGAQLARPDAVVVGITGDGGFNMAIGELETARRLNLPIIVVVINNAASGYVKALQHAMYGEGAYQSSDLVEMDYAQIAKSFGCRGIRVESPAMIAPALAEAMASRSAPVVLDVVVTRDPAKMLPGIDNRTVKVAVGDRPA